MIEIKKADDISACDFQNKLEAYVLKIDDQPTLYCIYKIEDNEVEIYDIKGDLSDNVLIDAIIRAVASYARGKGAEKVKCKNSNVYAYLTPLGFEPEESGYAICALSERLLRHTCCREE